MRSGERRRMDAVQIWGTVVEMELAVGILSLQFAWRCDLVVEDNKLGSIGCEDEAGLSFVYSGGRQISEPERGLQWYLLSFLRRDVEDVWGCS